MYPIKTLIDQIEERNLWDKTLELKRKEYLKVKGCIDTNLYFIVGGSLRIYVLNEYE